jgi:hypothetical protein
MPGNLSEVCIRTVKNWLPTQTPTITRYPPNRERAMSSCTISYSEFEAMSGRGGMGDARWLQSPARAQIMADSAPMVGSRRSGGRRGSGVGLTSCPLRSGLRGERPACPCGMELATIGAV